ncbi:MAG: hypothetical protein ACRCZF_17310, partial [Gemmataceae bacterium]
GKIVNIETIFVRNGVVETRITTDFDYDTQSRLFPVFPKLISHSYITKGVETFKETIAIEPIGVLPIEDTIFTIEGFDLPNNTPVSNKANTPLEKAPTIINSKIDPIRTVETIADKKPVKLVSEPDTSPSTSWRTPTFIAGAVITLVGGVWWFLRRRATA